MPVAAPRNNEFRGARVGQTTWERRHPCLLASVSRSSPGTKQARMPALPGSLPYTGSGYIAFVAMATALDRVAIAGFGQLSIRPQRTLRVKTPEDARVRALRLR